MRAGQREGSGSPFPTSRSSGSGDRFVRVAAIAASVSAPYVIDHRLRRFVLHLERRDQGVFCGDGHTLPVAGDIDSNREFQGHIRIFLPASRRSDYGPLASARFPARKTSGLLAGSRRRTHARRRHSSGAGRNNKRFAGTSHSRRSSTRLSANQPVPTKAYRMPPTRPQRNSTFSCQFRSFVLCLFSEVRTEELRA